MLLVSAKPREGLRQIRRARFAVQVNMEYVQTVLVQIAATKLDEASGPQGLLPAIEAHRDLASAQRGFQGMRITRTANPEGDVLVVVETRWANNNAMADYSTLKNNVESIIRAHEGELVPSSLQVHRMESLKSETAETPARIYDRLALALLIPLGVLAFALLSIYGLSRIYLALPSEAATPLAAGIALGVLGISWYFASNPSAPRWQVLGIAAVAVATLAIGGTAAAIYDESNKEVKTAEPPPSATAPAGSTTPAAPGAAVIGMEDNKFVPTDITVASGTTINLNNKGLAVHNVHVADASGNYASAFCKATGTEPCSKPAAIPAGSTGTITVSIPAGTYDFRCDFHPVDMKGKLTVK
jgi:plastocyanin/heme-degrading monooxygenase HmoA